MQCIDCILIPLDETLNPIPLPNAVDVQLGRSPASNVRDLRCSRTQLSLCSDFDKEVVYVLRRGVNPSLLNGECLRRNASYEAKDQMILELLPGSYKYKITFRRIKHSSKGKRSREGHNRDTNATKKKKKNKPPLEPAEPSKKQINFSICWSDYDRRSLLLCQCSYNGPPRNKVAGFDLDGTLIKTISGKVFPKNNADWKFWGNSVVSAIRKLHADGFFVVIFTNQGFLKYEDQIVPFKVKIDNIIKELEVPVAVLVATNDDIFRKPAAGMWNFFLAHIFTRGVALDYQNSFYVGDAAGRIDQWAPGKKKDFSVSDRLFARNVKLKFKTPEEFFLGQPQAPYDDVDFHPSVFEEIHYGDYGLPPRFQEVITMVGSPASGKSFFVQTMLVPRGYVVINRDSVGTWSKCEKLLENSLRNGNNIVIDNTNADAASRKRINDMCKTFRVSNRCFIMNTSPLRCLHNNRYRQLNGSDHALVAPVVLKLYRTKYEEPTMSEGFSSIVRIPFVPRFESPDLEALYKQYLFIMR